MTVDEPMPGPSTHRQFLRYVMITCAIAAAIFVPFYGLALYVEPFTGDLARTGNWSERDFGWRAEQPVLDVIGNARGASRPDVLVLGDSFSMGNVWQSEFARRTGSVTYSFGFEGHGCSDEFVGIAASGHYASAGLVMIQTIERYAIDRLESRQPCPQGRPQPFAGPEGRTPRDRPAGRAVVDWRALWKTASNMIELRRQPTAVFRASEAVNVPITDGSLFSNRLSSRLLYYPADEAKAALTEASIERAAARALAWQRTLEASGRRFALIVIPDKSTVYRKFIAPGAVPAQGPDLAAGLARRGVTVIDLGEVLRRAAPVNVDLYLPDDTHLSARGFALVGEAVARALGDGRLTNGTRSTTAGR